MATEASAPVNGDYGAPSHTSSQSASLTNGGAEQAAAASPPKDEVGWYFVEQYYTTMSRSPDKVHLFYNKRSQFVYGVEAEKVPVSVGQRAINERISELDFEDCKVRVTNVDSQESGKSIVLQVIGEMSVKSQPHRKFAQTFVLAEQPNGYFVLNDIFRYIADEPEDDDLEAEAEEKTEATSATEAQGDIKTLTSSDNLVEQAKDVEVVDKKLEQVAHEDETRGAVPATGSAAATASTAETTSEVTAGEIIDEKIVDLEVIKPELPKDPEPSPIATPAPTPAPTQATKEPAAPPKPAAPKTWASIMAGNRAPVPIVPTVPIGQAAQSQAKAAPVPAAAAAPAASASAAAATSNTASGAAPAPAAAANTQNAAAGSAGTAASPGGWQTAGQDHGKKQARGQTGGNVNGYIKNVTSNIEGPALRQALAQHGKVVYFDISRQKNCAFVEFETAAGFNAAVAANPHKVNGEDIILEERHPKPSTYGNNYRGAMRGNRNSMDGRTPSQGGRGGFKDNRGGFVPRGRGGGPVRGRGGAGQEA